MRYLTILFFVCMVSGCFGVSSPDRPKQSKESQQKAALINVEMGHGYLEAGQVSRAKAKLVHAVELAPNIPETNSALAYYYETVGDIKEAEKYYKKSIQYNKGKAVFNNNYAMYLCRRGRFKESDKFFASAIQDKFYDKTAEVYENMGHCAIKEGDVAKAEKYLRLASQHDPNMSDVFLEIAELSFNRGDYRDSLYYLNKFKDISKPIARSIFLSIKIADKHHDQNSVASNGLMLKNLFPQSQEYKLYTSYYREQN